MGIGNSKSTNTVTLATKNTRKNTSTIVDPNVEVQRLIDEFVTGIAVFKKNDMKELQVFLNGMQGKDTPNMKEILDLITKTENVTFGNVTTKKAGLNTDELLYNELERINNDKMMTTETRFIQDPALQHSQELQKKVVGIFQPYKRLQTERMFYRYKYIQMNIIFIVVVKQFQEIFKSTMAAVDAEYANRLEQQKKILTLFIQLAQTQSNTTDGDKDLKKDIGSIANEAYKTLDRNQTEMKSTIDRLQNGSLEALVNVLVETNQISIDTLKKAQANHPQALAQAQSANV